MKRDFTKIVLYAYPRLEALGEASAQAAQNKAALSFLDRRDGYRAARDVFDEFAVAEELYALKAAVDELLLTLTDEERFLLGYKYFRNTQAGNVLPCSERSYFRRQSALLCRVASRLTGYGWTDSRFRAAFRGYAPFRRALFAIRSGRERTIAVRRMRKELVFQSSSESGDRRFPLSTSTATNTAAAQARQMSTICNTSGDLLSSLVPSPSVSPATGSDGTLR